jgi:hypothetical protein
MIPTNTNTQKQYNQLEICFFGPVAKDMLVQSINDLTRSNYNYDGKIVWVSDEKTFYFLQDGATGDNVSDWIRWGNSATIANYSLQTPYAPNTCVIYNGSIYRSIVNVPTMTPPTNESFWEEITSTNHEFVTNFTNKSTVNIPCPVQNATVSVFVDNKKIDAEVNFNPTPDANGNVTYNVSFYERSSPMNLSGKIILK